ncbi:MAG: hypothetical protein HYZ42_13230, partial [Bacteroidetes bacterium]|nr:hypothetical protein [Bacteroidota bacterium]
MLFTFDKDVCPDSLLSAYDTSTYLNISPQVKGRFKWNNTRELIFIPENGFKPCTEYTCKLSYNIEKLCTNKSLHIDDDLNFVFHTPYLKLSNLYGFWEVSEENPEEVVLKLDMNFNYQVSSNDLKQLLTITVDNKKANIKILPNVNNENHKVIISGISSFSQKHISLKAAVAKGLGCAN